MGWPIAGPRREGWGLAAIPARNRVRLGLAGILCALLAGCANPEPARRGAEEFIDRYYVSVDPAEAREYAVGFARGKLDRELALLEDVDLPEAAAKPAVNYRFLEERAGTDARHRGFLYELTITFRDGEPIVRRALVTVREDQGQWRVANFQELD